MMLFLKIAWRNVLRNQRRSIITIVTITFGFAALIFLWGFVDGAHERAISKTISIYTGHFAVSAKGFQKKKDMELVLPDKEKVKAILTRQKGIAAFSERIICSGLVGTIEKSRPVAVIGVDPKNESLVTTLHTYLVEGSFLGEDGNGIVLPRPIADDLKLKIGKKVVFLGQGSDGSMIGEAFPLKGIIETHAEVIDESQVFISLTKAQELFVLGGDVFQITVKLERSGELKRISGSIQNQLGHDHYEVLTWRELIKSYAEMIDFENSVITLISLVFLIVVASGILNTMLMSVLERTREFGVVTALGTKPHQVVLTVSLEGFFLGATGVICGTLLGLFLVILFGHFGIDISAFSNAETVRFLESKVYPVISFDHFFVAISVAMAIAVLMSAYPAWKAARMDPIEAIRHI